MNSRIITPTEPIHIQPRIDVSYGRMILLVPVGLMVGVPGSVISFTPFLPVGSLVDGSFSVAGRTGLIGGVFLPGSVIGGFAIGSLPWSSCAEAEGLDAVRQVTVRTPQAIARTCIIETPFTVFRAPDRAAAFHLSRSARCPSAGDMPQPVNCMAAQTALRGPTMSERAPGYRNADARWSDARRS